MFELFQDIEQWLGFRAKQSVWHREKSQSTGKVSHRKRWLSQKLVHWGQHRWVTRAQFLESLFM